MPRIIAECNKAICEAWRKEQELVKNGKGTRDWTLQQQQQILEKGKAYDESGKAFEGQHMKSAEKYPEYQGNPGNIQFLTRTEHLEAHDGNWQNPTNWYYKPITKKKIDFCDGPFIPCKEFILSESIIVNPKDSTMQQNDIKEKENSNNSKNILSQTAEIEKKTYIKPKNSESSKVNNEKSGKINNIFVKGLKATGRFVIDHPKETLEIAGVVVGGLIKTISSIKQIDSEKNCGTTSTLESLNSSIAQKVTVSSNSSVLEKVTDIIDKTKKPYTPNDVPTHPQRYHTKTGIIWKNVPPYHRDGKEEKM